MDQRNLTRRDLLKATAVAAAGLAGRAPLQAAKDDQKTFPRGKADACIFIWLGGGAGQVDTFDPKPKGDGKKQPGSYYDSIPTAVSGVRLCEHMPHLAPLMDRAIILRTVHHAINSEHGAASNLMHTGRLPSGTLVNPGVGAIVHHQLGAKTEDVPAYVVMGYPNIMRDPGFLGAKYGYVYLTQTETGPTGLMRPPDVDVERQARRERLLGRLRQDYLARQGTYELVKAQNDVIEAGFRMAGPRFSSVFDLEQEPKSVREAYGSEFGQRCLLARRLVEAGSRFIEVSYNLNFLNGAGWDVHNETILDQHKLIQDLDRSLATLIADLERRKLLDTTLIVVSTEFGRPPEFDSGGGRGHQSNGFSVLLAGGGLKTGQAIGETDELGGAIANRPITVPDYLATVYAALGIDPAKYLFAGTRPVPITDQGVPVAEAFG